MTERAARGAAPDALALFAALGALMTDRAAAVALASAVLTTAIGIVLAWRRVTRWPLIAGLAVAAVAWCSSGTTSRRTCPHRRAREPPRWPDPT